MLLCVCAYVCGKIRHVSSNWRKSSNRGKGMVIGRYICTDRTERNGTYSLVGSPLALNLDRMRPTCWTGSTENWVARWSSRLRCGVQQLPSGHRSIQFWFTQHIHTRINTLSNNKKHCNPVLRGEEVKLIDYKEHPPCINLLCPLPPLLKHTGGSWSVDDDVCFTCECVFWCWIDLHPRETL